MKKLLLLIALTCSSTAVIHAITAEKYCTAQCAKDNDWAGSCVNGCVRKLGRNPNLVNYLNCEDNCPVEGNTACIARCETTYPI